MYHYSTVNVKKKDKIIKRSSFKMRIRFKQWARPELEASAFYIDNPENYKGKWKELFENDNPIHLELGCGKGQFISQLAVQNDNVNYIAVDLVDAMLGLAKRNVESTYKEQEKKIKNVFFSKKNSTRRSRQSGQTSDVLSFI